MSIEIQKITKRYWWPHPYYIEARLFGYNCYKPWRPYIDLVIGYRYFIDGREVSFPVGAS